MTPGKVPDDKKFDHKGRIIRAEIETSATPRQAWEAWADPQKIAGWFVDRATGDGTAGSIMTWFFDDFGYQLPYNVAASAPGKLFVLKWDPPQGPSGIVEVRIEREGGATVVRLINSGFKEDAKWDEEYEGVSSGWQMALAVMKEYLENHFGRPKASFMALRPASFEYKNLRAYFLDQGKLAEWLTTSGAIGAAGDTVELELRGAGKFTGRVLAVTKSEVALSWKEIGGTLELKVFSMGPQRMLGVRVFSWKLDAAEMAKVKDQLQQSVDRLAALFPAAPLQTDPGPSNAPPEEKR